MAYKPSPAVAEVLEWALSEIKKAPYEVSTRWAFYQVVQNYGYSKDDYAKFKAYTSKARKQFYNGWHPTTFTDDTRSIDFRGHGYSDPKEWMEHFKDEECVLSKRAEQDNILLVLYEAEAMSAQFEHYLSPLYISSSPFKGDASIRHKWNIATRLAQWRTQWRQKPIVVLYFGDLDPKGLQIPRSALYDIYRWLWMNLPGSERVQFGNLEYAEECEGSEEFWSTQSKLGDEDRVFTWKRIGLSKEQVETLDIPDNPEKPGQYQWEALGDEDAGNMILEAVAPYWDVKVNKEVEEQEDEATEHWKKILKKVLKNE